MTEETGADALADELYAGPPTEFVARRDELSKQTRAAGDRALAAALKALRRPSMGAWYLNTAARSGLASLRELLQLGGQLREAQAAGDFGSLRDLAQRRGPLTADVVRDVTALLARGGTTATAAGLDEVRTTLAAALADPGVARQVERGRVDRPHAYGGFGEVMAAPAPAPPAPAGPATTPNRRREDVDDQEAARAAEEAAAEHERRAAGARREVEAAEARLAASRSRREQVAREVAQARGRVDSLAADLAAARQELSVVEGELAEAESDEEAAVEAVERARLDLPS